MLAQDRGRGCCDTERLYISDCYPCHRVVARIHRYDKRRRHRASDDGDSEAPVRQRLVVKCHRRAIDRNVHRFRQLQWRQLPQPAKQAFRRPSRQHDLAVLLDPHRRALEQRQLRRLLARGDHGQLVLPPGSRRGAVLHQRTRQTARLRRRTERRAELHQPLVQIAGRRGLRKRAHQLPGRRPQRSLPGRRLDVILDGEHPRQHARDVAIHQRRPLAKRDRCDRPGRVGPDPGHLAQLRRPRRERPTEPRTHRSRAGVQVARARVVPEPGPRGEHVVERRPGERRHRRKPRHPALPVRDHRLDPRLLQHDLADPDRIRIPRPPPRQVALHARVVSDHSRRDRPVAAHARSYRVGALPTTPHVGSCGSAGTRPGGRRDGGTGSRTARGVQSRASRGEPPMRGQPPSCGTRDRASENGKRCERMSYHLAVIVNADVVNHDVHTAVE
jgi:hypothetical protein